MSFASDARGELARLPFSDACCVRSELSAALLCSRSIAWRGRRRYAVTLTTGDGATVRRYFSMLKRFYGISGQIRTLSGDALNGQTRYQLAIPEADSLRLLEALSLLQEGMLFDLRTTPPEETVRFSCCQKSFVRGVFLMCGTLSNPEKAYHLEYAIPGEDLARFTAAQLAAFELDARLTERKGKSVVYLKRVEDISDALTLMGASGARLALENARINKEVRNRVNRQMNFDASNITRTTEAAQQSIQDILYLDREVGLDKLPKSLREMALVRANNPESSLVELGELMDPPLGKSGVSARLRRIAQIAEKLRCGEDTGLG